MSCRAVAHDVYFALLVVNVTPLESCRGVEIDFASKDNINIVGLSEGIVKQLVKEGLIYTPLDLYSLKYDELIQLEGFKDKKVVNLLSAIENSKHPTMDRFIHSLNINGIGSGVSKLIASILTRPMDIINITRQSILDLPGVGEIMADNIISYIGKEEEYVWNLVRTLEPVMITKVTEGKYKDKVFVITGTLSKPRSEIEKYIESNGGVVGKSVTSKTSYLISNDNTSAKHKDALKLGIRIIEEKDI
jgi:DNA ligase (NAD+)